MSKRQQRILIADDQQDVREALRLLLKNEGYQPEIVSSPGAVLRAVEKEDFDVLLMDLNYTRDTTSGKEGLDLLSQIQSVDHTLPVVVMTAWGSVELVVEAMRSGARDFVQKPWDNVRLLAILRTQTELGQALRSQRRLEAENRLLRDQQLPNFVAESRAMKGIVDMVRRVGPSDANVLILGENGTGKSLVAQAVHVYSERSGKPMITVNAGGLPEGVFESELFGHVRGAFTDAKTDRVGRFELADGSTLFLDEIANVAPGQQTKLLRVIETGQFEAVGSSRTKHMNVRIISATNADIQNEVQAGRFRQDLLFRLNTIEIRIPPLRERREDIPVLATHFLQQHSARYRKSITGFEPATMQILLTYSWPGNVRELDHTIERAVLLSQSQRLRVEDLGLQTQEDAPKGIEEMSLEEVESFLIKKALDRYNGNVS